MPKVKTSAPAPLHPAERGVWFFISTFFYVGLSKYMPGTVGSLASLLLWAPLVLLEVSLIYRLLLVLAVFGIGCWAVEKSKNQFKSQDPKEVVIDEAAGLGLVLAFCEPSWGAIILGFSLFRLFDIVKPWPISWVDRKIKGPIGVMLDDIAAALAAIALYRLFV